MDTDVEAHPYNAHAWITGSPQIGEGTWIGAFALLDGSGGLTIGPGCDISSGVHIYTHSSARRCVSGRAYGKVDRAPTRIGTNVFVGANATILMGVSVGDRAVIAAGSVVTEDVEANAIVAGSPARQIGLVEISGVDVRFVYD